MLLGLVIQLVLGFVIALSGALIPGPLSVFVITTVVKSGKKTTGLFAGLGHCLVEVGIIGTIVLGLTTALQSPLFQFTINIVGGIALMVFGTMNVLKGRKEELKVEATKVSYNSLMGGVVFTLFNATIPIWWATIGLQMLSQAMLTTTVVGVLFWVVGHWLADISWFGFLGYSIYKGEKHLGKGWHNNIITVCGVIMIVLGLFFLFSTIF